jgi:hypothetical protein
MSVDTAVQRWCVWAGVVLLVCFGAGVIGAGFFPPPAPMLPTDEVVRIYAEHSARIQAGMVTLLVGTTFWMPWTVVITCQLRRMEGRLGPLSLINLVTGALGMLVVMLPALLWLIAAYRPAGRSPDTVQALHDAGWLTLVGAANLVLMQNLVIGVAILRDRSEPRVLPRWAGYLNLWTVPLLVPGFAVYVFHSGPLAWNGIFAWWVPVGVFGGWFIVMIVLMFRAVAGESAAASSDHALVSTA